MKASELYQRLDRDFVLPGMTDEWIRYMAPIQDLLTESFKQSSIGLVCDFASEIKQVRTAVFPTDSVLESLLDEGIRDSLLYLHHPSSWDLRRAPDIFVLMSRTLLEGFRERRIAVFAHHVPLDHFGPYSTGVSLAHALQIVDQTPFAPYGGGLSGVLGTSPDKDFGSLKARLEAAIGHAVRVYPYGDPKILGSKVAVVAGGGNSLDVLEDLVRRGINTFVTGVSVRNDFSERAHKFAEGNGINVIGGTHYSTEAFACRAMVRYFEAHGLTSAFVEGEPLFEDL